MQISSSSPKLLRFITRRLLPLVLTLSVAPAAAWAQATGVSDERVSLPEGPGSLEGVGENASLNHSMGLMSFPVNIKAPQGYSGMTPSLSLSYSSGGGGSVIGMGWSMGAPVIERATVRGLPRYTQEDEFNAGGALVRIPGTDWPVYRSRFEGGFTRYTWHEPGDGSGGWWLAEYADGRRGYFGADMDGALVPSARVGGAQGTFRYHLVDMVDRYDHKIRYTYRLEGSVTLLSHVGWVYNNGAPEYELRLDYEAREDALSDCKPGFEERLESRLAAINVFAHATRIRRYELDYEPYEVSGGFTRLAGVTMLGLDDTPFPVRHTFAYSQPFTEGCEGCQRPYMTAMGSLGVGMGQRDATLIDINGDALPDVIDSAQAGQPHRVFINRLEANGDHYFAEPQESAIGNQGGHDFSSPYCQVIDMDGDGFTDLVNVQTGDALRNRGGGDWDEIVSLWADQPPNIPDLNGDFDPSDGQMSTLRFFDYNGDKRMDLLRAQGAGDQHETQIYRNVSVGGFSHDPDVEPIGAGFESDRLELNDMNGDGLLDAVQVTPNELRFRLNMGWGRWSEWRVISGFELQDQEVIPADLEDLNGDALADLVLVSGSEVRYWLNRNGESFDPERRVSSADVDGELPERSGGVMVLYADMNGSGSSDIVWIDGNGAVDYLELFPVRPNLLTRIENGLGKVIDISYSASVVHMARDGGPGAWTHPLPHPMTVVDQLDEWDELTQLHSITQMSYHDGYYDGDEKQFRGYEVVRTFKPGGEGQEEAEGLEVWDVGAEDPYYNGLLIEREIRGAGERSIQVIRNEYADCPVAGIPDEGLDKPIRSVCLTDEWTEHREGLVDESRWVMERSEKRYDGYGNVSLDIEHGIVSVGGAGCGPCDGSGLYGEPCGPSCLGDERYSSQRYARPEDNDDLWMLNLVTQAREYGIADETGAPADEAYSETLTYYDGPDFEGLPLGQVSQGAPIRVTQRIDESGAVLQYQRSRLDAHGNLIESLDPLGEVGGETHRRIWTMDPLGLRVTRTEILLSDEGGAYRLHEDYQYDPTWDKPIEVTEWRISRGGVSEGTRNSKSYGYDAFGRPESTTFAGELEGQVTQYYEWEMGRPLTRLIIHARSESNGDFNTQKVLCYDGRGRVFQERNRIKTGEWLIDGFKVFNIRGKEQIIYQPYTDTDGECDRSAPDGVFAVYSQFDAIERVVQQTWPDVNIDDGQESITRVVFEPFAQISYDLEDTLENGPHANTPTITYRNGLGQTYSRIIQSEPDGTSLVYRFFFDPGGEIAGWEDPSGNRLIQERDLLNRIISVNHPNSGEINYEYNDANKLIREINAEGDVQRAIYDGNNRILTQWDESNEAETRIEYKYDYPRNCLEDHCTHTAGYLAEVSYPLDDGTRGADWYGYDLRAMPMYFARTLDGARYELRSEYDNAGRLQREIFPGGLSVDYQLDDVGRLVSIPGYIDAIDYDARGKISEARFANGTRAVQSYDARQMLETLSVIGPEGEVLLAQELRRNHEGHPIEISDGRLDDGAPLSDAHYQYDSLYRLTQAHLNPGHAEHEEILDYAYGPEGNLLSKQSSLGAESPAHIGALTYGEDAGPHAVTHAGELSLRYDAAGRVIARGDAEYTWDFLGRMVGASASDVSPATFIYGSGSGRVIKREGAQSTLYVAPELEVRDGIGVVYLTVDGRRIVKIMQPEIAAAGLPDLAPATGEDAALISEPDGFISANDAWLSHAAQGGALNFAEPIRLARVDALLDASLSRSLEEGGVRWLHANAHGDTSVVSDESGALIERMEYYPYGLSRYASHDGEDHGYTGKEADKSTGLLYFGARYLDPLTGRWITPDPEFAAASSASTGKPDEATNVYGFNRGNPVSYVDDDGRIANFIVGGIVGAVSSMIGAAIVEKAKGNKLMTKSSLMKIGLAGLVGGGVGVLSGGLSVAAMLTPLQVADTFRLVVMGAASIADGLIQRRALKKTHDSHPLGKYGRAGLNGPLASFAVTVVGAGVQFLANPAQGAEKVALKFASSGIGALAKMINNTPSMGANTQESARTIDSIVGNKVMDKAKSIRKSYNDKFKGKNRRVKAKTQGGSN